MKIAKCVLSLVATLGLAVAAFAQLPAPAPTQAGLVQGAIDNGLTVYKGIPFAAPPLGDLRWRAPQPPAAWSGVRHADKFAPACIQVPIVRAELGMEAVATNEDCLYLNVWTPAKSANDKLV